MGDTKLCLLLLLISAYVLAGPSTEFAEEDTPITDGQPICPLAARYKNFRKYVYQYTAESRNGVAGTANLRNGPKISCQVELEVPQTCSFVLRTTECALTEVSLIDAKGQPVYRQAAGARAFKAAMEKNPLNFEVDQVTSVAIYPETGEPENIVNIKRGIISALIVPVMEAEHNKQMATIHGLCKTDVTVNSRKDIDTDVTISRDLSKCSDFKAQRLPTSPLALLPDLQGLMTKLIHSTQTCNYQFDNRKKHMTVAQCTEKHILLPFSHESEYGISSVVTQSLTLQDSVKINNRHFTRHSLGGKPLWMSTVDDKLPSQSKDEVMATLRELSSLAQTEKGQQRASLFHKLVSELRGLKNETLSSAVEEMMEQHQALSWQALAQCGSPECSSAILQHLRTFDDEALEVDAAVYAMGLLSQPSLQRVRDMLSMAQRKPSKAIMYALANTVKNCGVDCRGYDDAAPVLVEVAEFMQSMLGDCSGDEDKTFLTLRVIGVMGRTMQNSPFLKSSLVTCMHQRTASLSVQKAAIQALRLMHPSPEVTAALLQVFQDAEGPAQKRIAAYLLLIREPIVVDKVIQTLMSEQDLQVKSFVASHIANILSSEDPEVHRLKRYILLGLQDNVPTALDFSKFSHNFKMDVPMAASVESNVIFDGTSYLPREVMLETTLKAFGYAEKLEIGLEGEGFEPTIEALFGHKGFFPDTISKALFWADGKVPQVKQFLLDPWITFVSRERMKRHVPEDIIREISHNFNKLVQDIRSQDSPEAMAYLRMMGTELGYIKANEMKRISQNIIMYSEIFFKILPLKFMQSLVSSTDNELFAHYIFMDKAFALPTASGFPLKFSLSGVFAPGAKGGLKFAPGMKQLSFMPSVGVEFVTQMGIYIPEFVVAGIEMHTNIYHESALNAKVTLGNNQVKLSIPAPQGSTQLFSISNKLLSVTSTQTQIVPSMVEDRTDSTECSLLFTGVQYCTTLRYSNASSTSSAPYYPLTGETRFAVELQPTGDVTAYTADLTYELLKEGKEGRQKVDSLKIVVKCEGADLTKATATMKYNRNRNIFTTDLQIPDYDLEVGLKLTAIDSNAKGKRMRGINIDITNKNIPQLTLVGRARLDSMKDGMLQVQMSIPSLNADATATATMKNGNGMVLQLETALNVPETSSLQKVILRYDENKVEVEMKSDTNSEIEKLIPNMEEYRRKLQTLIDDILDKKVAKTDMKLRHIVTKAFEAVQIWLEKLNANVENLRNKRNIPEFTLPSVPEKLYLTFDTLFRYQFNKDKITISLPLPLGGKTSEDLNIPPALSVPHINVPVIGLEIPANNYRVPSFTIPRSFDFSMPLLGLAEVSSSVKSNFYNWKVVIAGGNDTVDVPSYIAKYTMTADSPVTPLSYQIEGTGMITGTIEWNDTFKYLVNGSLKHCLLDVSFSVFETLSMTDKLNARANYKVEASSPIGLHTSLYYSAQSASTDDEVTGGCNVDGVIKVGPLYANSAYTQTYSLKPPREEGRGESTLRLDSSIIQANNMIKGVYANGELSLMSKTNLQNDALKHVAELKYKDAQLSLKSDCTTMALGKAIRNKAELGISNEAVSLKIESQADDATNRAYSLITGSLNGDGLELNMDGSLSFDISRGSHKATLTLGRSGLATSSTTTLQCSPLTFENVFNGGIDSSGASLSLMSKGTAQEKRAELSVEGKLSSMEAYLNSVFKGNAFEADTRNTMNLGLNKQGLAFSNNMMGSLQKMKTESTHTLTLTLWTLAFRSKTDNFICKDASYNHDIKVNMKPFVASLSTNNDLVFFDINLSNEGLLQLEPLKMELTGSLSGAYGEEDNIKHTYGLSYADLAGSVKYSTTGKILGSQVSHNCELDFAGLSSKSNCEIHVNSKPLRLESTIRTMAMPFSLTVDAILNSDGEVNLYGKHTGQLYSKFLMKAEPFAFAQSHDCRASATHLLPGGESAETHLENKFDGLLTPGEQSAIWKMKSKLNNHAYNLDFSAYNNDARVGAELAGVLFTNLLNKDRQKRQTKSGDIPFDNQEFSVSAFLKYDKNSDSHIIYLPFIESLPAAFEQLKTTVVSVLESLQQYINSLDINDLVGQLRANLDSLPQRVGDFMRELDLENKVSIVKEKLISLAEEYAVTLEDMEEYVENLKMASEKNLIDMATKIKDLIVQIREFIESGSLSSTISNVFTEIGNELKAFDERNQITKTIVRAVEAIEDIIRQIDLQKLQDSSLAWLQDLDANYEIRTILQDKITELKQVIETFDIMMFVQGLGDFIISFDLTEYMGQLTDQIPSEDISRVFESMKDVIVNWIEEYEIVEKMNNLYSKVRELFLRYDIDKKIEVFMDQAIVLIKQYRIQETVQAVVNALKSIQIEYLSDKFIQLLDTVVSQLKSIDFKQSIDGLNEYILTVVKNMKAFDYNMFVDEFNQKISELTNYVNEQIQVHEIPQKIEASREFFRKIQATIWNYLEKLKETRIAEIVTMVKDVIDTTIYRDIKLKVQDTLEDMRQRISDMDIRNEIMLYLQRASDSYINMVAYISVQFNRLIEEIRKVAKDQEILNQINQAVEGVLNALKTADIEIPSFTVPLTDLVVPTVQINLPKLQDISIPTQFTVPAFTILSTLTVPSITIDFEEIKQKIISFIDTLREFEVPMPEAEAIFGDLRALYLSDLPDLTFPQITFSEIKFPAINLPKLNLENFEITMLPIPEVKLPQIPSEVQVPAFGKLYGEFRVNSPHYTLMTAAALENSTSTPKTSQFTATLTSQANSTLEFLDYSMDATLRLEAPKMKKLVLSETVKATHMAFSLDHQGSLIFSGRSAEATAKTTSKVTTKIYTADLVNNIGVSLKSGISASMDTTYNHNLNIPTADISSQATMTKTAEARFESGTISVTVGTMGSGKWSIKDYSDEGTHKSNLEFNINIATAKLTFSGETNSKALKMKQTVNAESVMLSYVTVDARAETETPFIKSSVIALIGKAQMEDLKIELTASHNTELIGKMSGTISNSLEFLAQPFEITLDCKNKGNSKIILPLKLTGKIDLQNDFGVILNSELQRACWVGLARFNQYKYNHNFTLDNNEKDVGIYGAMNGEANLDFLTVRLTIPDMTVPYINLKTPMVKELSLWEHYGLKNLLTTPRQSFDMDFKLQYQKNPDKHAIEFDLEPIYDAINENAKILSAHFELGRDKAFAILKASYNEARTQYSKFRIDTPNLPPRIFTVPGYTVPILNIEVSAFRAELPAFSFVIPKEVRTPSFKVPMMGFSVPSYILVLPSLELPVLHVPETLSELTLPAFTLPDIQNSIMIPALGNMTYDFSFKSTVITLNANGGLYNQSDIVAKFGASSTSVFDILKGKLDSTTSLTRKRGLKLATALSLEHMNVEFSHDSMVSLTKRNMEASLSTVGKVTLPILTLELNQELLGNTKAKPNVASKMKVKYTFNLPLIEAVGNIDQNLALEALTSYLSLETSLKGKIDGTVMESGKFSGALNNEANFYLNANGLRSTVKTDVNSRVYKQADKYKREINDIWNMDMNENFALEASLRRVYATLKYTSNSQANTGSFRTTGKHSIEATLDFVPLTTLLANLDIDISQSTNFGHAGMVQNIDLAITTEKQKLSWSGREQLESFSHAFDLLLSNNEAEIRMEVTESVEGNLAFLKSIKLPVYQKNVWDVLKFNQATNMAEKQFLNASTIVVYIKTNEGIYFSLPTKVFDDGVTFSIPEITLAVPSWVKEVPKLIREMDMRFENIDLPDHVSIPPVIPIPYFLDIPFTSILVSPFTIDLQNLQIPNIISIPAFEIRLPGLPEVEIPSFDIETKYFKDKMSFLSVKLPQYIITISSVTLPKISNFDLPTITIPEQKIEIPEISLYLPASVFIPSFGALSTTVKLSSNIYKMTLTANLENKEPGFVSSLKSTCTSTILLLQYDLDATATVRFENGAMSLDGKCTFAHSDLNVDWKHNLRQNLRMKRQTGSPDVSVSSHTLDVDLTSQTFADVSFRYASRKSGITASVSSPSAGFIGFLLQRKSPAQYYGKLFSRSLSTPDKDTDLLSFKATLKNSEKLSLQTGWYLNGLSDMMHGIKDRMPAITSTLLKFINKHHTAHFGMDVNRAGLKLKNTLSNSIERAYHEVPRAFDTLQNSIEHICYQGKDMFKQAAEGMSTLDLKELGNSVKQFLGHYEQNIKVILDAIMKFLKETKFHLPGLEERLSGQELYHKIRISVSSVIKEANQIFDYVMLHLIDTMMTYANMIEFTLPGTNQLINGMEILEEVKHIWRQSIQYPIGEVLRYWEEVRLETLFQNLSDFLDVCIQKTKEFVASLRTERLNEISSYTYRIYSDSRCEVSAQVEGVRRTAVEYKDLAKMRFQEIYSEMSMERLNSDLVALIELFESHVYSNLNEITDLARIASQNTAPYVRVTSKKMDVDIPLPFYWKSFSEWPSF